MPRKAFIPIIAIVSLAGSLAVSQPAAAAAVDPDHPPVIGMLSNTTGADRFQEPQRWGDGDIELLDASPSHIEVRFPDVPWQGPAGQTSTGVVSQEFVNPDGGDLHVGRFVRDRAGDFDVLDLAVDASGQVTRFDIVFRTAVYTPFEQRFGEIRMGQPDDGDVRFAGSHVHWPSTPVRGTRVWAYEGLRNASDVPVTLGRASVVGRDAAAFAIADDTCSGTTLAAGATCTIRAGFSPVRGGPQIAALTVQAGERIASVALAGEAPSGISRITVSGNNHIALGKQRTDADGPEALFQVYGETRFSAGRTYVADSAATDLAFWAPVAADGTRSPLRNGTYQVDSSARGAWGMDISRSSRGCNGVTGTEKLSNVRYAPDGTLAQMHATFRVRCGGDPAGQVVDGEFLWRNRNDVTPPSGPRGFGIVGTATRTVSWGTSASRDAAGTIVRLVPGDGSGALPTSGYPVGAGPAGSAELLGLPAGQRFTVMAWAVDATGNVSGVLRRGFTT